MCQKHPRYQAKRKPTADCRACRKMFRDAEQGRSIARKIELENRLYSTLRGWFEQSPPRNHSGTAVGRLTVHQTVLFDAIREIIHDARR